MNHTPCINASCDQPQAPFSVYCLDCLQVELGNDIGSDTPVVTSDALYRPSAAPLERRSETVQVKLRLSEKKKLRLIARNKDRSLSDTVRNLILVEIATSHVFREDKETA